MTVALRHRAMTEAEFLAWAETREERYEFDGRGPVAMVGSTPRHGLIQVNLLVALRAALRGTECRVLGSDTFVRVAGTLRLPDAMVLCRDIQDEGPVIADPDAVFEILSDSTAAIDRTVKTQEYWQTPSVRHYVMLEQDRLAAEVLSRGTSGWRSIPVEPGGTIELPALGISLSLAEPYDGLRMPRSGPGS